MSTIRLDITKDTCPMTLVKTKLQLDKLQQGDLLEILLKAGKTLEDIPKTATEQGFLVLESTHVDGDIHKVVIRKISG
jgi:TusA-related sulfurtransferase